MLCDLQTSTAFLEWTSVCLPAMLMAQKAGLPLLSRPLAGEETGRPVRNQASVLNPGWLGRRPHLFMVGRAHGAHGEAVLLRDVGRGPSLQRL